MADFSLAEWREVMQLTLHQCRMNLMQRGRSMLQGAAMNCLITPKLESIVSGHTFLFKSAEIHPPIASALDLMHNEAFEGNPPSCSWIQS